eukprot:365159-Chlamydomonas_euryale.AAC.30
MCLRVGAATRRHVATPRCPPPHTVSRCRTPPLAPTLPSTVARCSALVLPPAAPAHVVAQPGTPAPCPSQVAPRTASRVH